MGFRADFEKAQSSVLRPMPILTAENTREQSGRIKKPSPPVERQWRSIGCPHNKSIDSKSQESFVAAMYLNPSRTADELISSLPKILR